MVGYIPKRGDFIRLNFDPQAGHEQMGSRPALVLSHTSFNRKLGFASVCPISTTKRKNPFYIPIPDAEKVAGVIMALKLNEPPQQLAAKYTIDDSCSTAWFLFSFIQAAVGII